ncbi:uncharacterized protein LOC143301892 [Babylonia areolata]|uniref:uncharacterized protein LOC143301892 n=1 Tax=Babylonia areolata TaxID=304850 RepID=UPI003FD179F6
MQMQRRQKSSPEKEPPAYQAPRPFPGPNSTDMGLPPPPPFTVVIVLLPVLLLLFLGPADVTGQQEDRLTKLERMTSQLARQLMLQQLYVEEAARSSEDSGIKQTRRRRDGQKPYHTATHTSRSVAAIHDHSDQIRTLGMGEFIGVLNGVEFRTRHNDYKLRMPSRRSSEYHVTEDIPFPRVPPRVLQKTSVEDQITEMRKWFKAWVDQDHSDRDYRKYFKPNLCYLEGAWTTDVETLDEPFDSDRHQLEAGSWFELQEQIRFTSYTGDKNYKENFAYLPTTVLNITAQGDPVFAQWNYRILCHPIVGDLNLSNFHPIDHLATRLAHRHTLREHVQSRAARFRLEREGARDSFKFSLLDELMYQVPGKDNYRASINDSLFDVQKVTADTGEPLNAGYYHRVYKVLEKDAMGESTVFKGFADRNLYVAQTTQPRVAAVSVPYCKNRRERMNRSRCQTVTRRVSYAIPLEVVYTTPLHAWNPYGLAQKGEARSTEGKTVKERGRRTGRNSSDLAFNGTNNAAHYLTPAHFFTGSEVGRSAGDTSRKNVSVLDTSGNIRAMRSSGLRIHLPNISGVGVARTRWPIMAVSTEGSQVWKELEALRDVVMDMKTYLPYFPTTPPFPEDVLKNASRRTDVHIVLETSLSDPEPRGLHMHTIELSRADVQAMRAWEQTVRVDTSRDNGHAHTLIIGFDRRRKRFRIVSCDGNAACFDGHEALLTRQSLQRVAAP